MSCLFVKFVFRLHVHPIESYTKLLIRPVIFAQPLTNESGINDVSNVSTGRAYQFYVAEIMMVMVMVWTITTLLHSTTYSTRRWSGI